MALVSRSAIIGKAIPVVEDAIQNAVADFAAQAAASAEATLLPEHEHGTEPEEFAPESPARRRRKTEVDGSVPAPREPYDGERAPGRATTATHRGGTSHATPATAERHTAGTTADAPHHTAGSPRQDTGTRLRRTTSAKRQVPDPEQYAPDPEQRVAGTQHHPGSEHHAAGSPHPAAGTQHHAPGAAHGSHRAAAPQVETIVSMPTTTVAASVATITTATATAGPESHTGDAAAAPAMPPGPIALTFSFAIVAAAGAIAYGMPAQKPFQISSAMAAYGALLVFATAVERIIEPFTHWLPGRHATNVYEHQLADLMNGKPGVTSATVALAKAHADRATSDRAHIAWGMATGLAILAAASSGFYLLHMISASDFATSVPTWADAILTGLVVGSGTKPLHDLISRAQSSKDSSTPTS